MSSALRLYVAPAGEVTSALHAGLVATGPWADRLPDATATAARVAAAVAAGGADLDVDAAAHVVAVVEQLGALVAVVGHGPYGGGRVRDHLLGEVLAPRFGADQIARLVLGPVAGCTFPALPTVGVLRPFDQGIALMTAGARGDRDLGDADATAVALVRSAVERAAVAGHDLIGVLA